jgi:sentrin-specific protease 8
MSQSTFTSKHARLTTEDASLFEEGHWLNDSCISFYFYKLEQLFDPSLICFLDPLTSFILNFENDLEEIESQLAPLNLSPKSLIVIPVNDNMDPSDPNGGTHWSLLLCYIKKDRLSFLYVDSMRPKECPIVAKDLMTKISTYLELNWELTIPPCAAQANSSDCGIFVLEFAEESANSLVLKKNPNFLNLKAARKKYLGLL